MERVNSEGLREELMMSNSEFRDLVREHGRYEARLSELASIAHPSDSEITEEVTLKKKKLAVKDQMHAILIGYEKAATTH